MSASARRKIVEQYQTIEQLQAKVAELEEEIERLRADNIAFARNLKGKYATTGATYEHICTQLAAAVARATKPLEDSLAVVKKDRADLYMETLTLRDQLAKEEQRVAEACEILARETLSAIKESDVK